MKSASSLTLTFLLFAFLTKLPLAFSNDVEQVLNSFRKPIFQDRKYNIFPESHTADRYGGLGVYKTKDLECPVTIMQDYENPLITTPVKFTVPSRSSGIIYTGTTISCIFVLVFRNPQ